MKSRIGLLAFLIFNLSFLIDARAASPGWQTLTNVQIPLLGVGESITTTIGKERTNDIIFSNMIANATGGGSINATNPVFYESITLVTGTNLVITNIIWNPDNTNTAGTNVPPVIPPIYIPGDGGTLTNTSGGVIIPGPTNMPPGSPTVGMSNIVWLTNFGLAAVNGPYQQVTFPRWVGSPAELWLQLPLNVYPKFGIYVFTNGNAEIGSFSNAGAFSYLGKELKTASITFTDGTTANRGARADLNSTIVYLQSFTNSPQIGDLSPYLVRAKVGTALTAWISTFTGPPFSHADAYSLGLNATFVNGDTYSFTQQFNGYDASTNQGLVYTFTNMLSPDGIGPYYICSSFYCSPENWTTNGGIGATFPAGTHSFFYSSTNFCPTTPPGTITGTGMNTNTGATTIQTDPNSTGGIINGYLVFHPNSGDCTYLVPSAQWVSSVMSASHSGYGPNWIYLNSNGIARLVLLGITVDTVGQSDNTKWRPCRENHSITHD